MSTCGLTVVYGQIVIGQFFASLTGYKLDARESTVRYKRLSLYVLHLTPDLPRRTIGLLTIPCHYQLPTPIPGILN